MQTKDRADFTAWLICATVVFLLVVLPPGKELAQEYAVNPLVALLALDPLLALALVAALSTTALRLIYKFW